MRITLATLTSALVIAAAPASGFAQESADGSAPATVEHAPAGQSSRAAPIHRPSFLHVLAYGAGGSLVGGWTGFMTSQVIWSDWLGKRKPDLGKRRVQFTVSGAAVGTLLGTFLGFRAVPPQSRVGTPPSLFVRPGSITADEIRSSSAHDAAEAVRLLRPAWLTRQRGNDVIRIDAASIDTTLQGKIPPFEPEGIRVYLDDSLLGGLAELSQFPVDQIARIEFWDARAATLRWGAGNGQGAIRIVTNPDET